MASVQDLQNVANNLNNNIIDVSNNLDNNIKDVSNNLQTNMNNYNKMTDEKINTINEDVSSLDTKVTSDISSLETKVTSDISSLDTKVTSDISSLDTKVTELNKIIPALYINSRWTQKGADIDAEAAEDRNGNSVSLSSNGNIVAIGAHKNDGNGTNSGHVRVYKWNGSSWNKIGQDIDGEAAGDESGISVSLNSDGHIVAIGAPNNNDGNGNYSGHVRIYKYDKTGDAWNKIGQDIDGEAADDWSGYSVSLSSDGYTIAIGVPQNPEFIDVNKSGHVRVYQWNGTLWNQIGQTIDGESANDKSGFSVSLSYDGTIVAIGAHTNDGNGTNSGHVRVYKWNGSSWNQIGPDMDGEAEYNLSGATVSLSSDGSIVAIGAPINNDGNGFLSGHVRVYKFINDIWTKIGQDIDGEAGDFSGRSVSLSSDGSIVAIGAPFNDDNGTQSGHLRIYKNDTVSLLS